MNPNDQKDLKLQEVVEIDGKRYLVSTIKMEVRHAWINQNEYVKVYETMVFEKEEGQVKYDKSVYNKRYTTYEKAVAGHKEVLKHIEKIVQICKNSKI